MRKFLAALATAAAMVLILTACGAHDYTISVFSRENGSGTRGAFIELFKIESKNPDGTKRDLTTLEAIIANKTDVMMTGVASDENAIGYISIGSLNSTVKALAIDGAAPTSENIINGTYKISRPFNIVLKGEGTDQAKDFIGFIMSAEGQKVIAKSYIPVKSDAAPYSGSKPAGKIIVAGSSSVTPIMEKLKEAYIAVNPNITIEIQMSDSTSGITGTIDGTCDIGMSSRDLNESEKSKLNVLQIAKDGIAVIVNNKNPLDGLSKEDIRKIFTGKTLLWNRVGVS